MSGFLRIVPVLLHGTSAKILVNLFIQVMEMEEVEMQVQVMVQQYIQMIF